MFDNMEDYIKTSMSQYCKGGVVEEIEFLNAMKFAVEDMLEYRLNATVVEDSIYRQEECLFNYCPSPEVCKKSGCCSKIRKAIWQKLEF